MFIRISKLSIAVLFVATAVGLFVIKDKVGNLQYQLNEINKQVTQETNNIHMLKAEIAYLISPNRLRKLVEAHLNLDNIKSHQLTNDPLVNNVAITNKVSRVNIAAYSKQNIKWRYKKAPTKYLKTVSQRR